MMNFFSILRRKNGKILIGNEFFDEIVLFHDFCVCRTFPKRLFVQLRRSHFLLTNNNHTSLERNSDSCSRSLFTNNVLINRTAKWGAIDQY